VSPAAPRATVVIVSYEGAHLLRTCLPALGRQELPGGFRTVVVDNASTDGTLALLAADFPYVDVIANTDNRGFAGGNNSALRHVTTDLVVLLNNDARPEPGWLAALLAPFDAPGGDRVGVTTGKVVFAPRFLRLPLVSPGFSPGPADPRELGVRITRVEVDGTDVTEGVLWDRVSWGTERHGDDVWRWTRPSGELLVPVPDGASPRALTLTWAAEAAKTVTVDGHPLAVAGTEPTPAVLELDPRTRLVDVINNVGGVVLANGHGGDRGFEVVDDGRYDTPAEVFTACGNGMAMRTAAAREAGFFDESFFLYYEDTDLSWRLRARGWGIRYVPGAVLRHDHAATSVAWSPRWLFHVDRNRLLMLTKVASPGLALRVLAQYPLTTVVRPVRAFLRTRSLPALGPLRVTAKVLASYLRLLPEMLRKRREITRTAVVPRAELERQLTPVEAWLERAA